MTKTSSAYLENIWAWVADHDFDSGVAQTQIDIYVARGKAIQQFVSHTDNVLQVCSSKVARRPGSMALQRSM